MNLNQSTHPRNWDNSQYPGAYTLATRASEVVINPGESLRFEQYITGYGEIHNCKIQCYMSTDLFDPTSTIKHSPTLGSVNNGLVSITWGGTTDTLDNAGFSCICSGFKAPNWNKHTLFFDTSVPGMLLCETKSENAPFTYELHTNKSIKPGNHYIDFYMTYFNGAEWKVERERLDFKVNNAFEQYSSVLSILAAAALIVTIAHDGISPLLESLHDIGKLILARHSA